MKYDRKKSVSYYKLILNIIYNIDLIKNRYFAFYKR